MSDYKTEEEISKEIEELKGKYSSLFRLDVPMEDGTAVLLLRPLDRVTYSASIKLMQKDELQAGEMILKSLKVGGDDIAPVIKDFESLRVATELLIEVITPRAGGNVAKL